MPGVTEEQVKLAREIDLLTYLRQCEPQELKRTSPTEYRTASHGSLVISHGKWYWWRGGYGGASALDYLIKVRGMGFVAAVETICCSRAPPVRASPRAERERNEHKRTLELPPESKYAVNAAAYLQKRGICPDVVRRCLASKTLYESHFQNENVCVFVGADDTGKPRFACMRGITGNLKRDVSGSDKRFSFRLPPKATDSADLAVFESPVDALSHATLFEQGGSLWDGHRLSLSGTSPLALTAFLDRHPGIERISLCLDADEAGMTAARDIQRLLAEDKRFSHVSVAINPG